MTLATGTGRAALVTAAGVVELRELSLTPPPPGAVTVAISLCGVCGTDVASFRSGDLHSPAVCGHEWVGVVSAVGAGTGAVREGERVVVAVAPPCGRCPECAAGLADHCRTVSAQVRGRDPLAPPHGGFADSITVAQDRVLPVPTGLTDVEAAQVEPTAVALHGVRRTGISPGDTVLVQGAGPVGLLAAQLARAAGAGQVVVVEPLAARRRLASALGADAALEPWGARPRAPRRDHVRAGTGRRRGVRGGPALLQQAVDLVRVGGTVTLLSHVAAPATVVPARWLVKEVRVVGAVAFTHGDVLRAMAFLADGRVGVAPMHSRTVGLHELQAVLQELADGSSQDVKVLVDPRRGGPAPVGQLL